MYIRGDDEYWRGGRTEGLGFGRQYCYSWHLTRTESTGVSKMPTSQTPQEGTPSATIEDRSPFSSWPEQYVRAVLLWENGCVYGYVSRGNPLPYYRVKIQRGCRSKRILHLKHVVFMHMIHTYVLITPRWVFVRM